MPGLVRGMVRTAAVVGTATATRNAVDRRQAEKNARAYADAQNTVYAQQPQQVVYAPPPQAYGAPQAVGAPEPMGAPEPLEQYSPAAAPVQNDMIAQLERLGALKAQGLLTDEEFAAAKAKLLG